jgi:nicotinate-nucleotide adenylyltransferase
MFHLKSSGRVALRDITPHVRATPRSRYTITMTQRIGLYGGSFNPVHHGHLIIARSTAERLSLDRIILLPSSSPPHKQSRDLADANHRLEMIRQAINGETIFELSDFDLKRAGPTYTVDTVAHFRTTFGPEARLYWLIGTDSLAELTTWRQVERILDLCDIATAHRPGHDQIDWQALATHFGVDRTDRLRAGIIETPRIDISSSNIRERVHDGQSIRYLVPDVVAQYIAQQGLYRNPPPAITHAPAH